MYEVEMKFRLDDAVPILAQLKQFGATQSVVQEQRDRYFAHPSRDFAQTDEALRIRSDGPQNRLTYKGPVLDDRVKTRHEIELSVDEGPQAAEQLAEMLTLLGFSEVRTVAKRRIPYHFIWEGRPIELTLDEVDGLGTFLEIETLAEETERDSARDCILRLAAEFQLQNPIRKSYLCLLLEIDG